MTMIMSNDDDEPNNFYQRKKKLCIKTIPGSNGTIVVCAMEPIKLSATDKMLIVPQRKINLRTAHMITSYAYFSAVMIWNSAPKLKHTYMYTLFAWVRLFLAFHITLLHISLMKMIQNGILVCFFFSRSRHSLFMVLAERWTMD